MIRHRAERRGLIGYWGVQFGAPSTFCLLGTVVVYSVTMTIRAGCLAWLVSIATSTQVLGIDDVGDVPFVSVSTNDEAWKQLGASGPRSAEQLPVWARALVRHRPAVTAAMLQLDYLHRVENPLDPKLRASIRWIAANANQCLHSELMALDDLNRAGATKDEIASLTGDQAIFPEATGQAFRFARLLTERAYAITDEHVVSLIKHYGEEKVVAMVLLLAHANFQDRVLFSLGVADQPSSLAPVKTDVQPLAARHRKQEAPQRETPPADRALVEVQIDAVRSWQAISFEQIQQKLELQKQRTPRITVPADVSIAWGAVCRTYQPELTMAWFRCHDQLMRPDSEGRIFQESVFWVVTRSQECFY